MTDRTRQLIVGAGGVLMIVALFLPWAKTGGESVTGWKLWTVEDIYLLIVAIIALATALTAGRIGVFRPDVSLIGAADLLSVVATVLLVWLLVFDWPDGASRGIGAFLGLLAAVAIMGGAGDYRPLKGAPWFPRVP